MLDLHFNATDIVKKVGFIDIFGKWVGSGYSNTTSCLLFDRRVEANYLTV